MQYKVRHSVLASYVANHVQASFSVLYTRELLVARIKLSSYLYCTYSLYFPTPTAYIYIHQSICTSRWNFERSIPSSSLPFPASAHYMKVFGRFPVVWHPAFLRVDQSWSLLFRSRSGIFFIGTVIDKIRIGRVLFLWSLSILATILIIHDMGIVAADAMV